MILPHFSQLHLWYTRLDENLYEDPFLSLLSSDEIQRAKKFKFAIHSKRFTIARVALRSILGLYLDICPVKIRFLYSPHGKPYLEHSNLQFNLSHSHDIAVYAFTYQTQVGVDIEKIRDHYNDEVAKRFFSPEEYEQLSRLPQEQKVIAFYEIWTGKEALVKALGAGIRFSLSSFTIPFRCYQKEVIFKNTLQKEAWYIQPFISLPGYQSAFATNKKMTHICYWEWTSQGIKKWREDEGKPQS